MKYQMTRKIGIYINLDKIK